MKRCLTLLILLIPCNGCMMIEDMLFVDDVPQGSPTYQIASPQPAGSCGASVVNVAASQTAEPELLQRR